MTDQPSIERLSSAMSIAHQIQTTVLTPLKSEFIGKDEVVDLLGVCLVAGENLFLHGPPGTAKSAIVQSLSKRIEGRVFDYLLTRFTEPSELFGPFDIRRLREGELVTNTEGMLPEANIIFLDELLNANSAILNSLLMALNEKVFRRGRETRKLDFVLAVGASNRLPEDEALNALFDRFLLRVRSENVPTEMLSSVLEAGWQLQTSLTSTRPTMSVKDLQVLQACIPLVDVSRVRKTYVSLVQRLRNAGIEISDRRAVKLQRLTAASALLCQRDFVHPSDLWVLRYVWDTLEQIEVLTAIVNEALQSNDDLDHDGAEIKVHAQSQSGDVPDPQLISIELDQIESQIGESEKNANLNSWLRDRLGLLMSRIEWVRQDEPREFLKQRVSGQLKRLELTK